MLYLVANSNRWLGLTTNDQRRQNHESLATTTSVQKPVSNNAPGIAETVHTKDPLLKEQDKGCFTIDKDHVTGLRIDAT